MSRNTMYIYIYIHVFLTTIKIIGSMIEGVMIQQ
jgi:hypothetical protein